MANFDGRGRWSPPPPPPQGNISRVLTIKYSPRRAPYAAAAHRVDSRNAS